MIKLDDGGSVFFTQDRIGKNGKKFRIYKFRTMSHSRLIANNSFEPGNISRITRVGSFLRRTKIDELPQMINILKGEMSFVGPRPEVEYWTKVYPERWRLIHQFKPGMTDNASIEFRKEEELLADSLSADNAYRTEILPKKLDLYEEYIKNRSFIGDIKIILRTIFAIINKNDYRQ